MTAASGTAAPRFSGLGANAVGWALVAPALCCVVGFVLAPIVCLGIYSFRPHLGPGLVGSGLTLENWHELIFDPFYAGILAKSLRLAVTATLICAVIGYGPAYFITTQPPGRRALLITLLFLPSWISYIVRSMSWLPILGKDGLINTLLVGWHLTSQPLPLLYNDFSIHVGMVQFLLPLMIVNITIGLQAVDARLVEAARTLGATGAHAFLAVTFPLALPGLLAGCLLTFVLAMGAYITPLILGGPGTTYYANLVFDTFVSQQNWPFGATLSLVIIFFLTLGLAGYARLAGLSSMFREART